MRNTARRNCLPKLLIVACLAFAGWLPEANAALMVNGYDTNQHDRFTNSSSFIGNPYDWSGVGRTSGGTWATLISSSYVISAQHFAPSVNNVVRFYETNDPNGNYAERTVTSSQQIAGADLWLGELGATSYSGAAFNIAEYPILTLPNLSDYVGLTIQIAGRSNDPHPANMRVGRNVIQGTQANFSHTALGSFVGDIYTYDYDTTSNGLGADEARLVGGDSGGPSFVDVGGQLAVVGVHWFIYDNSDDEFPGSGSGDTLVSSYVDDLDAAMNSQFVARLTSVPEPGSAVTLLVVAFMFASGKRRRRVA